MEHLFTKQISKHSIGAYIKLCREVGRSIKAIARPTLTTAVPQNALCLASEIDQLQAENDRLSNEVSLSTNKIRLECQAREKAEAIIRDLKEQLSAAQKHGDAVTQQNQRLSSRVERLTKRIGHSDKEVKRVLSRLCRLDNGKTRLC